MHTVLRIPELLHFIFEQSSRKDNIQNALVCKQWSEIALDVVWHDVDSLAALFNLLSPVVKAPVNWFPHVYSFDFRTEPTANDWERFEKLYSHRIRRLALSDKGNCDFTSILQRVARDRPPRPLLPNLRELGCSGKSIQKHLVLFMHEGVRRATISCLSDSMLVLGILEQFRFITPNLMHLEVCFTPRDGDTARLVDIVKHMLHLETVSLPMHQDSCMLFARLSRLKRLKTLNLTSPYVDGPMPDCPLRVDLLQSLQHLELAVDYELATRSLQHDMPSLRSIIICSDHIESPDHFRQLASAIANACRDITTVHLTFNRKPYHLAEINFPLKSFVSVADIEPLFQCKSISDLKITHLYALNEVHANAGKLGLNFPGLRSLVLNPNGSNPAKYRIKPSARVLLRIAKSCPNIEHLGIPFSTSALDNDISCVLHNLQTLDVGVSEVREEIQTALFFSEILPPKCKILWDQSYIQKSAQLWRNVQNAFPRLAERARLTRRTLDSKKKLQTKLKFAEERLKSVVVLEDKVLVLTRELERERAKNASFSIEGLEVDTTVDGAGDTCALSFEST
ncbi:hypothetical protein VKT23_010684 [Stygiomarasmius scandens]|uniref:F-box domain-containing protein n=1 Tax=Marasmiellus scandens TaxID=2682957 RepID=A0ABR1JBX5_9AGAR